MKTLEVARFELNYQGRQWITWLFPLTLFVLAFLFMNNFMVTAREAGTIVNAPVTLMNAIFITSLFGLLVAAALFGEAATRDVRSGAAPLLFTSSIHELDFLRGRFLGAFTLSVLALLSIPLGALLAFAVFDPGEATVAPFRLGSWLTPLLLLTIPNLFIVGVLLFSVALLTRRVVTGFVLCVALAFGALLSWELLAKALGFWDLAVYIDPLGMAATGAEVRTWSTAQRNTMSIPLVGTILWNRLVWIGASMAGFILLQRLFRFDSRASSRSTRVRREAGRSKIDVAVSGPRVPVAVPVVERPFDRRSRAHALLAVGKLSLRQLAGGRFLLLPVIVLALIVFAGPELMEHVGVPLVPEAHIVLARIGAMKIEWLLSLLIVIGAGEVVSRERDLRVHLMTDATPVSDAVFLWGKMMALATLVVAFQTLVLGAAVAIQLRMGAADLGMPILLRVLYGEQLIGHLLFVLLAVAIQVVVRQKYLGYLVSSAVLAFMIGAPLIGIEHELLVFGSGTDLSYSVFRGFGPVLPSILYRLYWAGWALLAITIALAFWTRSTDAGELPHPTSMVRRLRRVRRPELAGSMLLIAVAGGTIFYNTNVLNEYRTGSEREERRARYEKLYGRYEGVPQPSLESARVVVELQPRRGAAAIEGSYRLTNRTNASIETLHVATASEVETRSMTLDRSFQVVSQDLDLGHTIFELRQPLPPGASMELFFNVVHAPRGFTNGGAGRAITEDATYFEPAGWLPAVGYQDSRRLRGDADRREHGLPIRPEVAPLEDRAAVLRTAGREMIDLDVTIGTVADQIALAPGRLERTWAEGDRRYFRYVTDAPVRNLWAIFSAEYAVHRDRWNDVEIEVLHHPSHTPNLDRMVQSLRASLADYTQEFGPYPYGQIRLVEAPQSGIGLRSYPVNIRFTEGVSALDPARDQRGLDFLFAVIAHEVAHQWWGNQMSPAPMEGAPLLSESLAWYSAYGVVERTHGEDHLGRLMSLLREAYEAPQPRPDESLLRAGDWLGAYRRGPFAMAALRTVVGEERLNVALRRMLARYAGGEPPLPTSLDLYRELRRVTPAEHHPMLADLFERNTFWNLSTRRASAEPAGSGAWRVTMEVNAEKLVVDSGGSERKVPMDDRVEVGIYATADDGSATKPLHLQMHTIEDGTTTITVDVPARPTSAAIDPRFLLVDSNHHNNFAKISISHD